MDFETQLVLMALSEEDKAEGWDVAAHGDFIAPCGDVIEQDGACSCDEEHVSPLRRMGLI